MHNEQSSAPTSPSEPSRKSDLSEADYLTKEVDDAKAALSHAVADLKNGLHSSADLRLWVKHYPWAALGAATVAGFAAATAVTPAPGETVSDKLSRLRPSGRESANDRSPSQGDETRKSSSAKATLIDALVDLAKTLIQTAFLATMQGQTASSMQPGAAASPSRDDSRQPGEAAKNAS